MEPWFSSAMAGGWCQEVPGTRQAEGAGGATGDRVSKRDGGVMRYGGAHPTPHVASRCQAVLSRVGCLLGNCELHSRFLQGAEINNCAALLPAAVIKILIRSSN